MGTTFMLSKQYGEAVNIGGTRTLYSGSITLSSSKQVYDLETDSTLTGSHSGKRLEVQRVFNYGPAAITRFYDPFAGSFEQRTMLDAFGFGNVAPAVSFILRPVSYDIARAQAIETNDKIRKSQYSFELQNNKIRIFPNPTETYKLWFQYIVKKDRDTTLQGTSTGVITDFSNAPFNNMEFKEINDVGKQWIKKYGLALCKELLGTIRSKYASLPIPGAETTLDGDTLRNEATAEKEVLMTQLREMLEQMGRKTLLEADKDEAEFLNEKLAKVPIPIYIG